MYGSINWPIVLWYGQALLTPLIAAIAVWIAYQQYQTNYRQLETSQRQSQTNKTRARLDLFDRRYKIFEQLKTVLAAVTRDANVSAENLLNFRSATIAAYFLFGDEIESYIEEMYRRGLKLQTANRMNDPNAWDAEIKWFNEQYEAIKPKLKKYLDVSEL